MAKILIKDFIQEAIIQHNKNYNYTLIKQKLEESIYISKFVILQCNKCNYIFEQQMNHHLSGKGCKKCADTTKRSSKESFVEKAITIHGKKRYNYDNVIYKNRGTKVSIFCNKCNENFDTVPGNHIHGTRPRGCPCNKTRGSHTTKTYKGRRTLLYYIKVNGLYKIGLTLETIKKRYAMEYAANYNIEVINKEWFEDGELALIKEQEIIKQFETSKYIGPKVFIHGGDSELFTTDVLGLDSSTEERALILF